MVELFVYLGACVTGNDLNIQKHYKRLHGGHDKDKLSALWFVRLKFNSSSKTCSGSLYRKGTVITAANCVYISKPAEISVLVFERTDETKVETREYGVKRIVVHESYHREPIFADIAVLCLNTKGICFVFRRMKKNAGVALRYFFSGIQMI